MQTGVFCFFRNFFEKVPFLVGIRSGASVEGLLKTVEQMSRISSIGENKLCELMDNGGLEYIQNGNRRLISAAAIWDWYQMAKITAKPSAAQRELNYGNIDKTG